MATNTKNYNLVKPAGNELADISVINKNMDTIDEQLMPVNSLASEDPKKALAAAQGKVLKEKMGDLSALNTQNKENLVQAINEAAEGSGITVVTQSEYEAMQEAGTIDPDKLYGIVDAYDFSAGNVAISDVLAGKLGLASGKNVEKALEVIDEKVEENSSSMLKKDGTVQMTGVLKTVGNTVGVYAKQIQIGDTFIYGGHVSGNPMISIAVNCYTDGTAWRYLKDGRANLTHFGNANENSSDGYYVSEGLKDAIIAWTGNSALTPLTGLPLTGGTLTGAFDIKKDYPSVFFKNPTGSKYADIACDFISGVLNSIVMQVMESSTDGRQLSLLSKSFDGNIKNSFLISDITGGVTNAYKIYGEHNITASTSAPSSALAEGQQHQVYA